MFGDGLIWATTSFKGRLSQWMAIAAAICLTLLSAACVILFYYAFLDYLPGENGAERMQTIVTEVLPTGFMLLPITVKRLHDFGFSGWWSVIGLLPGIGFLIWLVYLVPGNPGPNRFGQATDSAA